MKTLIVLEGNIAAGKSTIINQLGNLGYSTFKEPNPDPRLLSAFYDNPSIYAIPLQMAFKDGFTKLYNQLDDQQSDTIIIMERSYWSQVCIFIPVLVHKGFIAIRHAINLQTELLHEWNKIISAFDVKLVYWHTSKERCIQNLGERQEQHIFKKDWHNIIYDYDQQHELFLNEYSIRTECSDHITSLVDNWISAPRIRSTIQLHRLYSSAIPIAISVPSFLRESIIDENVRSSQDNIFIVMKILPNINMFGEVWATSLLNSYQHLVYDVSSTVVEGSLLLPHFVKYSENQSHQSTQVLPLRTYNQAIQTEPTDLTSQPCRTLLFQSEQEMDLSLSPINTSNQIRRSFILPRETGWDFASFNPSLSFNPTRNEKSAISYPTTSNIIVTKNTKKRIPRRKKKNQQHLDVVLDRLSGTSSNQKS